MEDYKIILKKTFFTGGGKFISKRANRDWCVRNNIVEAYDDLITKTDWLPQDTKMTIRLFHYLNDINEMPICKREGCENPVKWHVGKYVDFCSRSCINKSDLTRNKIKSTNIKKYGKESPMQNPEVNQKVRKTIEEKYGVTNISKLEEIKRKKEETCFKNHGVTSPLKSNKIREKVKETNLKKYGKENPMQNETVKNKAKTTLLEKYGVDNITKITYTKQQLSILSNKDVFLEYIKGKSITQITKELNLSTHSIIASYLNKHGGRDLLISHESYFELEIQKFFNSVDIYFENNEWKIIPPYELDIYLPNHNIAIECNGSYWHSDLNGKDKNYHLNKTKLCQEKGIHLIHVWEHDWINNPEMVKTRLKAKLGLLERIYARKCEIKEVSNTETKEFLDKWHIQGNAPASVKYGLYHNDELISVMTFGKSRYKKDVEWELIRYCSIKNIIGGSQRLFKKFMRDHGPKSIISYSDKQWNTGDLYNNLGFEYSHTSNPSYYYTKNYFDFENRVVYQKHKLPKKLEVFDPNMTEWENMKINGYDRIWDCGTDVWIWKCPP